MSVRPVRCFGCHARSVAFTYRGAHTGRRGWHEATVMGTKREIYEGARAQGLDITRAS
jgi:hypothetical protein